MLSKHGLVYCESHLRTFWLIQAAFLRTVWLLLTMCFILRSRMTELSNTTCDSEVDIYGYRQHHILDGIDHCPIFTKCWVYSLICTLQFLQAVFRETSGDCGKILSPWGRAFFCIITVDIWVISSILKFRAKFVCCSRHFGWDLSGKPFTVTYDRQTWFFLNQRSLQ